MTYRSRRAEGLIRRTALGPNLGSFDLSNWEVAVGSGDISDSPSTNSYLTRLPDDSVSHDPGPYSNVGHLHVDPGEDFRVQREWVTPQNTLYRVTLDVSFLAAGADDRVSIGVYNSVGSGVASTVIAGSKTPFTTPVTVTLEFTTAASSLGEITHLRVNAHSFATGADVYFTDPDLVAQ